MFRPVNADGHILWSDENNAGRRGSASGHIADHIVDGLLKALKKARTSRDDQKLNSGKAKQDYVAAREHTCQPNSGVTART